MSDIDNNSQTEELKFSKSLDLNKDFNESISFASILEIFIKSYISDTGP